MAKCPKCDYQLKLWDIKAECPQCGINIPNYNWEERLEADSVKAEAAFAVFHEKTSNLKKGLFGGPFMIARFVLTFMPLLSLIVPIAKTEWFLPYYAEATQSSLSILNIVLDIVGGFDIGSVLALAKSAVLGTTFTFLILSIGLIAFGVLSAVLNFFMLIIKSISLKYTVNVVLCVISTLSFILSWVFLTKFFAGMDATTIHFVTGEATLGLFVGVCLFAVNIVMNALSIVRLKKDR